MINIKLIGAPLLRQYTALALISPSREVKMAWLDQSAGGVKPWGSIIWFSTAVLLKIITFTLQEQGSPRRQLLNRSIKVV